ncbi:hypothetical protein PFICI_06758 [Pestalotiopsis fici W106-1]|uniref:Uncharacterized protein n=1 Tax=Pestalotiopsis fici (strain W106-1 / CGMCC3.15140) TaxID=1229662 RepID=W3X9D1_PESFW|nr:uncharacterized protein PFICI_06758 [Pestalotiopsis fici W106-1]ETS81756.1 hypothetical protein PFICI_06758 [Pestalotiopsis fici W106-1]
MLADSPDQFENSPEMKSMEVEGHFSITNKGVLLDASTLRIVPKDKQASESALVLLIGFIDDMDHIKCYGVCLQKIGSANYARFRTQDLASFKEDKSSYKLKPVPRHQGYITISPQDAVLAFDRSHRKAINVPEKFSSKSSSTIWSIKVLDRVPERIWDYQNGLFFRVAYGHRDVVRAAYMVLSLLDQQVRFAVLFHQYGGKDKVVILDDKNDKWSTIKPIFGPNQRFDSVKWDDLMIDLAVQSEYLDVVAQGRSYRVSASLDNVEGKLQMTRLKLDVAPDAYHQIERLEQRLRDLENRLEGVKEKRDRASDDAGVDEGASKKHKSVR